MSGFSVRSAAFFIALSLFFMLPEAALNGQCSTGTGVCIEQDKCTQKGGSPQSDLCPNDPISVKCCRKASCSTGGSCMWLKDCKSGNTDPGKCPGPSTFICCLPPTPPPTLCTEQILLRAFIPAEAFLVIPAGIPYEVLFPGPLGYLLQKYAPQDVVNFMAGGGNNRTFCHDCSDSKADLSAFIKIDPATGNVDVDAAVPGDGEFGPTKIYCPWDISHTDSEPWWFAHIKGGAAAQPLWDRTKPRTSKNLYVAASKSSAKGGVLNFVIAAEAEAIPDQFVQDGLQDPRTLKPPTTSIPCALWGLSYEAVVAAYKVYMRTKFPSIENINIIPDINADISVSVEVDQSGMITYTVGGTHDAFPSYELYIGDKLVYSWDAVAQGKYLWNLASGILGFKFNQIPAEGSFTKSLATVASGNCGNLKP